MRKKKITPPRPRPSLSSWGRPQPPQSFNKPHMIELPLAAFLVAKFGDEAEEVIAKLSGEKSWQAQSLLDIVGDRRVSLIENRSLTLVAAIALSPTVKWLYGDLTLREVELPQTIRTAVAGEPLRRLVEHPFLPPEIIVAGIEDKDRKINGQVQETWVSVKARHHRTGIRHALKLVRHHLG